MELIWGFLEVGLTIGADLLPRAGDTCPHCGRAVEGDPPAPCQPKAVDEIAGRDDGQAARDKLSAALCGVVIAAMLGHMIFHWSVSSTRRPDHTLGVAIPVDLPPLPPVADLPLGD